MQKMRSRRLLVLFLLMYACRPASAGPALSDPAHDGKLLTCAGVKLVITPYAPVGPVANRLKLIGIELEAKGIKLMQIRREWDERFWPHATKGYFSFRENISSILEDIVLD